MSYKYMQTEAQTLTNALGTEVPWGWSPSYNPLEFLPLVAENQTINVLLLGSGDVRHIIRTLMSLRSRPYPATATVHIYVYEPNLRTHARTLFFLQYFLSALRSPADLELAAQFFIEVYGNTLLRADQMETVHTTSQKVLRFLGYEEGALQGVVNLELLKSKERDFIEEQIKAWIKPNPITQTTNTNVETQWNSRLRSELAERYDVRENILDYDFHMRFKEYSPIVRWPEYKDWRLTGVAFHYDRVNPRKGMKYEYSVANPTLLLYPRRGPPTYCGDITVGPYIALAGDTPSPHLKKYQYDGQLKYGCGVIAMHNVKAWMYEAYSGCPWQYEDHKFAWDDDANYNPLPPVLPETFSAPPNNNSQCSVHVLGLEGLSRLFVKSPDLVFHHVYASVGASSLLPTVLGHLDAMAVVVLETAKYCLQVEEEGKGRYIGMAKEIVSPWGEYDMKKTARLHEHALGPHTEANDTSGAQRAKERLAMPAFMAFVKKTTSA